MAVRLRHAPVVILNEVKDPYPLGADQLTAAREAKPKDPYPLGADQITRTEGDEHSPKPAVPQPKSQPLGLGIA